MDDHRLALRENPTLALAMTGFDPIAILVESRADVDAWAQRMDGLGIDHEPVRAGAVGWLLIFDDPDGIQLKVYTRELHRLPRRPRMPRGK